MLLDKVILFFAGALAVKLTWNCDNSKNKYKKRDTEKWFGEPDHTHTHTHTFDKAGFMMHYLGLKHS